MNGIKCSSGMKVRDMVRQYDTALKSDSIKPPFSSIGSSKSSYFGMNQNVVPEENDEDFEAIYADETRRESQVLQSPASSSRTSNGSQKTIRTSRFETYNDIPVIQLDTQKSFMNLSRSREPPRVASREKRNRHSAFELESQHNDEEIRTTDVSYQSKTIISKTPNGVRIIVDILFDQNKNLPVEDVVGSRIETFIPPSKILREFQKRVADASQD